MDSINHILHPDAMRLKEILEDEDLWEAMREQNRQSAVFLNETNDTSDDSSKDDDDNDDNDDDDDDDDEEEKKKRRQQRQSREQRRQSSQRSSDDDDDQDDDDDSKDEDAPRMTREELSEYHRLKREAAAAAKKAKDEERKRAADEGRHQDIIAEVERERDEAFAERDEAREELQTFKEQVVTARVAQRLHFHDPADAYTLLAEEDRSEDENVVEHALRQIVKKKSYLVDRARRRQARVNGEDKDKKETPEQGLRSTIRGVALAGRATQQVDEED